jgi:hypothetical protein
VDVIFVKENIVELPPVNHFSALRTLIEVPFLCVVELIKISRIHFPTCADILAGSSLAGQSQTMLGNE